MGWVTALVGFEEQGPEAVRAQLELRGDRLRSLANGREYGCGKLTLPSLGELRGADVPRGRGRPRVRELVADVQQLHLDPANAGALFQAASQFNLLEMVNPRVTPEQGVERYEGDGTQGPACAIACGAGTLYRNYLVPLGAQRGQCSGQQIDTLAALGEALGNTDGRLWKMQNGYALLQAEGLRTLGPRLDGLHEAGRDRLREKLQIGLHSDVQVTLGGARHQVTQVYGSALAVAYGGGDAGQWEALARLVLEASYEATLRSAWRACSPRVFLTRLGGGVFRNDDRWINDAILRALACVDGSGLDVVLVSHGRSNPGNASIVKRWAEGTA